MFKVLISFSVTLMVLFLVGCASIIHGTGQTVMFQSTPSGAMVEVYDALDVSYGACVTPCSLDLKRKREYKVSFNKAGYKQVELNIQKKTSGRLFGNILFGGLIGIVIDLANGAAYKLSPDELQASLSEESAMLLPDMDMEEGIIFVDIDNIKMEERGEILKYEKISLPTE